MLLILVNRQLRSLISSERYDVVLVGGEAASGKLRIPDRYILPISFQVYSLIAFVHNISHVPSDFRISAMFFRGGSLLRQVLSHARRHTSFTLIKAQQTWIRYHVY